MLFFKFQIDLLAFFRIGLADLFQKFRRDIGNIGYELLHVFTLHRAHAHTHSVEIARKSFVDHSA